MFIVTESAALKALYPSKILILTDGYITHQKQMIVCMKCHNRQKDFTLERQHGHKVTSLFHDRFYNTSSNTISKDINFLNLR